MKMKKYKVINSLIILLIIITISFKKQKTIYASTNNESNEISYNVELESEIVDLNSEIHLIFTIDENEYNYDVSVQNNDVSVQSSISPVITRIAIDEVGTNVYITNNHSAGEHTLDVGFTTTSGDNITQEVYIYSSGTKDCVSLSCIEESRSIYYTNFVLTENEKTLIENESTEYLESYYNITKRYEGHVFGTSDITCTNVTTTDSTSNDITITGEILWQDSAGDITKDDHMHPLINNHIYLVNSLTGSTLIKTDENGKFEMKLDESIVLDNTVNIYLIMYPKNDAARVQKFFANYRFTDGLVKDLEKGDKVNYEIKLYPSVSKRSAAYEIPQSMRYVRNYIKEMERFTSEELDEKLPQIVVYYPAKFGTYYSEILNCIGIEKVDSNMCDPCMHEYGHYVDKVFQLSNRVGGSHSGGDDLIHDKGKKKGLKLCYSESLATYLGISAQLYYNLESLNIPTAGDYFYDYSVSDSINLLTLNKGECHENTTIGLLLTIADNVSGRSYDNMAYGYRNLWNKIKSYKRSYMSELIEDLVSDELDVNTKRNLGGLLEHFGFAPIPISSNSVFNTYVSSTTNKFEWNVNNCGGNSSLNNQYSLIFYSSMLYDSYKIDNITNTHYTLTETDLNNILALSGDELYWQVAGYNTNTFTTGPYISTLREINKPIEEDISIDTEYTKTLITNKAIWYKFTAPKTGTYKFYTTSTIDTLGELFPSIVANSSTLNRLKHNDNGGTNYNFSMEYDLDYEDTIYIRIRVNNYTTVCDYTFKVECTNHDHEFVYESLNSSYHILKCHCGTTSGGQQRHVFSSSAGQLAVGSYAICKYCHAMIKIESGFYPIIMSTPTIYVPLESKKEE